MKIKIGSKAPNFNLPDQNGKIHKLADYKNKWLLIYFYPKDHTPGCTIEACKIRDNYARFNKIKAAVLGVSKDSVQSHQKFIQKQKLPFDLLADEDKKMLKAYGVWAKKKLIGREYMGIKRMSFLIDPKGKIAKIYEKVKPFEHAKEVLADLEKLKN